MKILIVTYSGYGNYFSLRFIHEGHSCDIYYCGKKTDDSLYVLNNISPTPFTEKPNFKDYDLVLFDLTGKSKLAEESLLASPTVGDSDFSSHIEENRLDGIEIMEQCNVNVPYYETFDDLGDAKRFVRKTNKRYVFKPFGGQEQDTASTYVSKNAEDMFKYLDKLGGISKGVEFLLQEVVEGTEISTEGWFNGEDFYLVNSTLEEKKFMEGGKGPNTGCSGNLVWVYDSLNLPLVFREGLGKLKDFLQSVKYRGMIDLNTIVSDREMYGLEWTPRFGYDASVTLFHCIKSDLGNFLGAIATGGRPEYELKHQFAAGVRLSIPPYPSEIHNEHPPEIPIQGLEECEELYRTHYLYDCCMDDNNLVTAGVNGFICVPLAGGSTLQEAFDKVDQRINRIQIPNVQYRNDIMKCTSERYNTLQMQGWLR
jgi:phosphoribosylamine--glycine ligase